MKFLNYPSESPFQQHILSQLWINLIGDVLNIREEMYRPRATYARTVKLDLDRGGNIKNVATKKVGENLEYGMELTIYWWNSEDEPIWYLQPFARTWSSQGARTTSVGSGGIKILRGHGEGTIPLEAFEKLHARISQIERNHE